MGMAELKRQLGDPRPSALTASGKRPLYTLSLVNPDSPSAYDGYQSYPGSTRRSYRLSTSPVDYAWETRSDNLMRQPKESRRARALLAQSRLTDKQRKDARQVLASQSSEERRAAGKAGSHNRWHLNRGIANPECGLCRKESM
jgi:hypothetical protein